MITPPLIRPQALLAGALCLVLSPAAWATFVTRSGVAEGAATTTRRADLLRVLNAGSQVVRASADLAAKQEALKWDFRSAANTATGGPHYDFVTLRAPFARPRSDRDGLAAAAGLPSRNPLRYVGGAGGSSSRRFSLPAGDDAPDGSAVEPGIPSASGAADEEAPTFQGFDPHGLGTSVADGTDTFSQTISAGRVGNWSTSFLGARANAGERIRRVRTPTATSVPGGMSSDSPLLFRDVVAAGDPGSGSTVDGTSPDGSAPDSSAPVPIPEPTTALFALGIIGVCALGRRGLRQAAARSGRPS